MALTADVASIETGQDDTRRELNRVDGQAPPHGGGFMLTLASRAGPTDSDRLDRLDRLARLLLPIHETLANSWAAVLGWL